MNISEKLKTVAENMDRVYMAGEHFGNKAGYDLGYGLGYSDGLEDGSILPELDTPAVASDIRLGKEVINADGEKVIGTMPEHQYVTTALTPTKPSFTVQEGYHQGCHIYVIGESPIAITPKAHEAVRVCSENNAFLIEVNVEPATDAYNEGHEEGYGSGYVKGHSDGETSGYDKGRTEGYNDGVTDGYQNGYQYGREEGVKEGYADGYAKGETDGYSEGHENGVTEGIETGRQNGLEEGKQAEYDRFWDTFQENGARTIYDFAFSRTWTDEIFAPKYDIKINTVNNIFHYSKITDLKQRLIDCGVTLDTSEATVLYYFVASSTITHLPEIGGENIINLQNAFNSAKELLSIDKLSMSTSADCSCTQAFRQCSNLTEIRFNEGIRPTSLNLQWSTKLSRESLASNNEDGKGYGLIPALADGVTGSVTVSNAAVVASFTEDEWKSLCNTKPTWTITRG